MDESYKAWQANSTCSTCPPNNTAGNDRKLGQTPLICESEPSEI